MKVACIYTNKPQTSMTYIKQNLFYPFVLNHISIKSFLRENLLLT